MTKRITPEEVRSLAEIIEGDSTRVAYALFELADQMEADKATRVEVEASNELFMNCLDRALKMWQKAHPDKTHMWPDGAKNIVWLLERVDELTARLREKEDTDG